MNKEFNFRECLKELILIEENIEDLERNYCLKYSKELKLKILNEINELNDKAIKLTEYIDKSSMDKYNEYLNHL